MTETRNSGSEGPGPPAVKSPRVIQCQTCGSHFYMDSQVWIIADEPCSNCESLAKVQRRARQGRWGDLWSSIMMGWLYVMLTIMAFTTTCWIIITAWEWIHGML